MLRTVMTAALALGLLTGCAAGGDQMPADAAGLTQDDVAKMSLHQEFDAYRDHYQHMQRLLRDAQLQVHDGEWEWGGGDRVPLIGGDGVAPLPGSDTKNSYDMSTTRLWSPPGASDQQWDLQPMIDCFRDQGWHIEQRTIAGDQEVWASTGDGWQIQYSAQENGDNPRCTASPSGPTTLMRSPKRSEDETMPTTAPVPFRASPPSSPRGTTRS
ncbi:hypothetical protein [Curtobacterium sp. VKM Ac-1376]|uniref:hypothetical protein n=1 Tax=Curtobacterium sp. VKM Ac-1376 TaxID=123312 RepID=UPI00188A0E57|nr:hypothetical protein [Curtobacterium sp. VKM Ac-1376]MBF4614103.1 hypothetical protein [Curtobacterium sp. VKM Ac-1376]